MSHEKSDTMLNIEEELENFRNDLNQLRETNERCI